MSFAGQRLGRYRLVTELGSGGMGTVYYAEHVTIGRRAAIKVLDPLLSSSPAIVERFFAEARAVNAIRHPNIIDIVDLAREGDVHYLVMELLEGETLGSRLERVSRITAEEMVRINQQVCSALGAVHQRGMVHRDLKPENIFLVNQSDGPELVKVLDFGVVKLHDEVNSGHTEHGTILGTPTYMSPEQCSGQIDIDARSDIYSLGIVTYEALTGAPPFRGGSVLALLAAHQTQAPESLRDLRPDVPRAMCEAVMAALEKDRNKRPESAAAFALALERGLTPEPRVRLSKRAAAASNPAVRKAQARNVGNRLHHIVGKKIAEGRLHLPAMPQVCLEAITMARRDDVALHALADVVVRDPLLTARFLQVASSNTYRAQAPVTDVESAIVRLGVDATRSVLFETAARTVFSSRDPRLRARMKRIWERALTTGLGAAALAAALESPAKRSSAQIAGLLRDVGEPILAALMVDVERFVVVEGNKTASWLTEDMFAEIVAAYGPTVSAAVAEKWDLPADVRDAIVANEAWDYENPIASISNIARFAALLANAIPDRDGMLFEEGRELLGVTDSILERVKAAMSAGTGKHPRANRRTTNTTAAPSPARRGGKRSASA